MAEHDLRMYRRGVSEGEVGSVAANETSDVATLVLDKYDSQVQSLLHSIVYDAIQLEREACAKICDLRSQTCAKLIRERGDR